MSDAAESTERQAASPAAQRHLTALECTACGRHHDALRWRGLCDCGRPLAARYDLGRIGATFKRDELAGREASLWRYRELLPLGEGHQPLTLGEGWTPLLPFAAMARAFDLDAVWVKDESGNPTGSFKARGLCLAVAMARAYGARAVALPSAGNAGGALAAYAAAAGLEAHVFLPADCPPLFEIEARSLGATVTRVPGFITDAGRRLREVAGPDWFDLSTLREPFRVEGKKTMGYELAEQLGWRLPDVILYPTGGGTGLVGMWKAFDELEELGWLESSARPRMVSVQVEGCAPIVRAFHAGAAEATPWQDPRTLAAGLRVPAAVGDRWMLEVLRASGGTAVAVSEAEMLSATLAMSRGLGIVAAPEGGAVLAAFQKLAAEGWIRPRERVVLFNTGTGLKYLEALEAALAAASDLV